MNKMTTLIQAVEMGGSEMQQTATGLMTQSVEHVLPLAPQHFPLIAHATQPPVS